MKCKRMYVTVGIPGSGKTTFCKKLQAEQGGVHISRDEIRFSLLNDDDTYFEKEIEVWNIFINRIQEALNNPEIENIYIDATHLTKASRDKLFQALNHPYKITQIFYLVFPVSLDIALARNKLRTGRAVVPEETIRSMYKNLTYPKYNVLIINEQGECKSE